MMRPRYYLQRDVVHPEYDVWAEMADTTLPNPKLMIYINVDGSPAKLFTLTSATANRLISVIQQFNEKVLTVSADYVVPHDNAGAGEK